MRSTEIYVQPCCYNPSHVPVENREKTYLCLRCTAVVKEVEDEQD